jgi:hypothetical protein
VATQWFRYAFGRVDNDADKCTLEALNKSFAAGDFKVDALVKAIVETDAFLAYRPLP